MRTLLRNFLLLSVSFLMTFNIAACELAGGSSVDSNGGGSTSEEPYEIPEDSVVLQIEETSNGKRLRGWGAELDPLFLSENVGETGDGWECKAEDWTNIFEPRMEEMNLQHIRVRLCPGYFCPTYENYANKTYTWASTDMVSLYQVLETAQKLDISVNITYWGVDIADCAWLAKTFEGWLSMPKEEYEGVFAEIFVDALDYLKNQKGYTCIEELTVFNEPSYACSFETYERICRLVDSELKEAGLRDDFQLNLADTAESKPWLKQSVEEMSDISDLMNAHTYAVGYGMTNAEILATFKEWMACMGDSGQELFFNEFGTNRATSSHTASDNMDPERGLEIVRIAANMMNAGIVGADYWVLFSQLYNREEVGRYMDMGLWGAANENYNCRPVFYAYTLLTRFAVRGSHIYPIVSADENIVAFAVKAPSGKWSYFVVNNGNADKLLTFSNAGAQPTAMKKYTYDVANVPTDNKVITAYTALTGTQGYLSDTVKGQTVVVYTEL